MKYRTVFAMPFAALLSTTAAAQPLPDGEVNGLNQDVFATLQRLQVRSLSSLDLAGARDVAAAVALDGKIDAAERDLLEELTQRNVRTVSIGRGAAPAGDQRVMLYPASGEARQVLVLAIDPALETAWASPRHGWGELLARAATDRAHVRRYLVVKLTERASESNMANRYKPFRDLISELHVDAGLAPGSDAQAARALLFEAAQETDRAVADKLPDFLYNWVNPPAAG